MQNLKPQAQTFNTSWLVEPTKKKEKLPQLELQQDTPTNQTQKPFWRKRQMPPKFATLKKSWLCVQKAQQIWLSRSKWKIRDTCRMEVKSMTCYRMIPLLVGFKRRKSKRWGLISAPSEATMSTHGFQRCQILKRNTSGAPSIHKPPKRHKGKRKVEESLQISPDLRVVRVQAVWIQSIRLTFPQFTNKKRSWRES